MFLQVIKWGLLALFVTVLTSCSNSIIDRDKQSVINPTKATTAPIPIKDNQNSTQLVRILEQNLSYQINNDIHQKTAYLKYSDNQNYSMYILPNYELIVEEPTQDLLFLAENEAIWMRIELLSDDIDWDLLIKSTYANLTSLYNTNPIKTALTDNYFGDLTILEIHMKDNLTTAYFINHPEMKLKLTMNTKTDEDHRDAFFQMAKTIMKESSWLLN